MEGAEHAELAIDRMGARQELSRRLAAQDVATRRRADLVGRIGLSALELGRCDRADEARQLGAQIGLERRKVEGEMRRDRLGAGKELLPVGRGRHQAA